MPRQLSLSRLSLSASAAAVVPLRCAVSVIVAVVITRAVTSAAVIIRCTLLRIAAVARAVGTVIDARSCGKNRDGRNEHKRGEDGGNFLFHG